MGHVTSTGTSVEEALERARAAAAQLRWAEDPAAVPVDGGKEARR
jgi:hypothetical protein